MSRNKIFCLDQVPPPPLGEGQGVGQDKGGRRIAPTSLAPLDGGGGGDGVQDWDWDGLGFSGCR